MENALFTQHEPTGIFVFLLDGTKILTYVTRLFVYLDLYLLYLTQTISVYLWKIVLIPQSPASNVGSGEVPFLIICFLFQRKNENALVKCVVILSSPSVGGISASSLSVGDAYIRERAPHCGVYVVYVRKKPWGSMFRGSSSHTPADGTVVGYQLLLLNIPLIPFSSSRLFVQFEKSNHLHLCRSNKNLDYPRYGSIQIQIDPWDLALGSQFLMFSQTAHCYSRHRCRYFFHTTPDISRPTQLKFAQTQKCCDRTNHSYL